MFGTLRSSFLIIGTAADDTLEGNGDTAGGAFVDNELRTALKFKGDTIWTDVIAISNRKKHFKGFFLSHFIIIGTI